MTAVELEQLELLARIDDVVGRLSRWAEPEATWEPLGQARAIVRRVLTRVESLRVRLEAPLVVATFGGTGTGKSTLVNALVGHECTATGRERPTTKSPVLIAHPDTEVESLGLPLDDFELVRAESPVLTDIVIVDCPDPDTSESDSPGSNLQRLHRLLPYCDVLIYTSTQQKYRSARVADELGQAAVGCRLLFVQTHADLSSDIRDDWRKHLAEHYEVPDLFFVDSVRALKEQGAGQRPSGDFGRLQDLLLTKLAASQRIQIRRANLFDVIHSALERCRSLIDDKWPEIEELKSALEEERLKMTLHMADQLSAELLRSRGLWERRLVDAVTQNWGVSPFSTMLRLHNGLWNLVAGLTLFRARNSAQMALVGALQGARWWKSRQTEKDAEERLARISAFGFDDAVLRESRIVMAGRVHAAQLDPELASRSSLDELREAAAEVEGQFLTDAGGKVDQVIDALAENNSRRHVRVIFETLFLAYVLFVLFRVGKNFFYDTFLREFFTGAAGTQTELLSLDFYFAAGLFFVLWTGFLVMTFVGRLKVGLESRIRDLAADLAEGRLSRGLFPRLEAACAEIDLSRTRLESIAQTTSELRHRLANANGLGAKIPREAEVSALSPSRS